MGMDMILDDCILGITGFAIKRSYGIKCQENYGMNQSFLCIFSPQKMGVLIVTNMKIDKE